LPHHHPLLARGATVFQRHHYGHTGGVRKLSHATIYTHIESAVGPPICSGMSHYRATGTSTMVVRQCFPAAARDNGMTSEWCATSGSTPVCVFLVVY
jgi:hypothetical protein